MPLSLGGSCAGAELSEQETRQFLEDFMGFQGPRGRRALRRAGLWPWRGSSKQLLAQLAQVVTHPPRELAAAREGGGGGGQGVAKEEAVGSSVA